MVKKVAPLTGVLFVVLLLVAVVAGTNSLKASSSSTKVLAYYVAHRNRVHASGVLTLLSIFVGVIFYGLLRDYLRRHEASRGLTATAFGGAILFAVGLGVSDGAQWALADSPSHLAPSAAQALNLADMDISTPLSFVGIAVLFVCFGLAITNGALLPKWLGWVAFPLALIALIPPIGAIAFIGAGLWTVIVSITLWRRAATDSAAATPAPMSA